MWSPPSPQVALRRAQEDGRTGFVSNAYGAKYTGNPGPADVADGFPWSPSDPRGGCVFNHAVFPLGSHQCMGPGVSPGIPQDDGDGPDSGDAQSGYGDGGGD